MRIEVNFISFKLKRKMNFEALIIIGIVACISAAMAATVSSLQLSDSWEIIFYSSKKIKPLG